MFKKLAVYSPALKQHAPSSFEGLADEVVFIDESGLSGDFDALCLCELNISDDQLKNASSLQTLLLCGPHIDQFSWDIAKEKGIKIAFAQGVNAQAITDDIFSFASEHFAKAGKDVSKIQVGLLGYGKLGQSIAAKFREIGCEVLAFDTFPDHSIAGEQGVELSFSLEELLWDADLVTCQVPYFSMTHNLLDDANLRLMKRGTYYIHLSKLALMDCDALANLIEEEHLSGATQYLCLEDLPADSSLKQKATFSVNEKFKGQSAEEIQLWVNSLKEVIDQAKTVEEYYKSYSWLDPNAD